MRIQAKTFNGHTIWDSDYEATILNPSAMPDAAPVYIEQSQADSNYSGMFTRGLRNVALKVKEVIETLQKMKAYYEAIAPKITAVIGPLYHDRQKKAMVKTSWNSPGSRMVSSQTASGPPSSNPSATVSTRPISFRRRSQSASRPPNRVPAVPAISPHLPSSAAAADALSASSRETKVGPHPTIPLSPNEIIAPATKM